MSMKKEIQDEVGERMRGGETYGFSEGLKLRRDVLLGLLQVEDEVDGELVLLRHDERVSDTLLACATSSAHTMRVGLNVAGNLRRR